MSGRIVSVDSPEHPVTNEEKSHESVLSDLVHENWDFCEIADQEDGVEAMLSTGSK